VVKANQKDKVIEAGILINWKYASIFGMADKVSDKLKFYTDRGIITDFDTLPGKGTLVPIGIFNKIGNFNYKWLPHYIGDYEFFCRAKKAGYKLVICCQAILFNFSNMTGESHLPVHQTSWKKAIQILFGRKSKLNIIDHLVFLILCCPKEYFWINLKQIFQKILNYSLMIFPLYYIKIAIDIYHKTSYSIKLSLHNFPIMVRQNFLISKIALFIHNFPIRVRQNYVFYKTALFFHNFPIRVRQNSLVPKIALFSHNLPIYFKQNKYIKNIIALLKNSNLIKK
jgi:GT2 family glycosyltransferase